MAEKKKEQLKEALVDVRHAYALLDAYQKRILNTCKYIGDKFDLLFYQTDFATDDLPPKRADDPFSRDPRVFLPLFNVAFLFLSPRIKESNLTKKNDWLLVVRILADREVVEEQSDLKGWTESNSVIGLYAFKSTEDRQRNWFWDLYQQVDWPAPAKLQTYEGKATEGYGRLFPMEDLLDKDAIDRVVSDFAQEINRELRLSVTVLTLNNV